MSASSTGIPPLIEQQLLSLDKQIRDVLFIRGAGRFVFGVCLLLAGSLMLDGWLDLSGPIRMGLLAVWVASAGFLMWRGLIRPARKPVSFSALAALVERQFPELSERLTSLVELRGADGDEVAPGASNLMQDLLARQTVKALDRVAVDQAASHRDSFRPVTAAAVAVLFLLAPFVWNSDGYGILWARFFVPWGNFGWGSSIDLKVVEGDQIVARGKDVNVHVALTDRRNRKELGQNLTAPIWLNWRDDGGSSDSRRLDWDDQSKQFLATLPHVRQSLTFDVTTSGAKSGTYRVDVSDPPSITKLNMEIEPAAYTGLPARTLTGIPAEIRVPEFSHIGVSVEFNDPVATAELKWPALSDETPMSVHTEQKPSVELTIPLELSADRRSGVANVSASLSGTYVIVAKNKFGLQNNDASRTLNVIRDQPPEIQLQGDDQPILTRPDDVIELNVEVKDDYGLSAVELHTETSAGNKQVDALPADQRRDGHVDHKFVLDLSQFDLTGGQVVTYRIRAVDNRPLPTPHEVWSPSRSLFINTSLKQLPDRELAQSEQSLEDELSSLRTELNRNKAEIADLHQETENEALNKQAETNKSERLAQLQNAQDLLIDKVQHLADRLAARRMTRDLATKAQQVADGDLTKVQERLEQSANLPARDRLQPLSQAIDSLGTADRQLRQLEDQLVDLNKLEQDLAELSRMAQHAERLADQLDKLDAEQKAAANGDQQIAQAQKSDDPGQTNPPNDSSVAANEKQSQASRAQNADAENPANRATAAAPDQQAKSEKAKGGTSETQDDAGVPQKLKDEANKLADQMRELLKKHPELLEAARRDQLDQLNELAEQARKLAGPQQRIAEALKEAAANAPALATNPENRQSQPPAQETADATKPSRTSESAEEKVKPNQPDPTDPAEAGTGRNGPDQPKTPISKAEQNSSQEKSDSVPAGNQGKDQPEKPADATSPNDATKPGDATKPRDAAASSDSSAADKSGSDKPGTEANSKPGSNETSRESTNDAKDNSSSLKQSGDVSKPTDGAKPKSDSNKSAADSNNSSADQKNPNSDANKPDDKGGQPTTKGPSQQANPPGKDDSSPNSAPKQSQDNANSPANPSAPNAQQSAQSAAQQAGSDAARQQEQIAREATKQALSMARETGADSSVTKAAAEFARKADAAKQQAQAGQLAQAAQEAHEAAKSAQETARQLNPDGQSNSPQSKQAQQLADQQSAAAKQMESLAPSADAAKGAQAQGQKQLADATSKIAEQMDQAAKSLNSSPLNSPKESQSGEKASQQTKQAAQSMKQSAKANQQNDPQQAAKAATDAAEKLNQAADSVPPTPPQKQNSLPVPKNVATQVAEVTKRLENAQKELSNCNCSKPGASGQTSPNGSQSSKPSQAQQTADLQQSNPSQNPTQKPQSSKSPGPIAQNANSPTQTTPDSKQAQQDSKAQSQNPQNGNQQNQKPAGEKSGQSQQQAAKSESDKPGQGQQGSKANGQSPPKAGEQAGKSQGEKPGQGQQQTAKSESDKPGQGQQGSKANGQSPPTAGEQAGKSQGEKPGQGQQQAAKSQGDKSEQSPQDSKALAQSQRSGESQGQQNSGQADQSSKVGSNQQTGPSQEPSQLAQVAEQFREIAAMLRQTRADPKENLNAGEPMKANRPGRPMPGQVSQPSDAGESGSNASGTTATLDLSHLDAELQQLARQNWGRLPGQLRTEILQGAGKKSHPEYTQRIKSYFDEITKPAK